jgi:hypothetical protein
LLLGLVLERGELCLGFDLGLFAGANDFRVQILDAPVRIIDLGAQFVAETVKLLAHINLLYSCGLVGPESMFRSAHSPSVEKALRNRRGSKRIVSANNRSNPAKKAERNTLDSFG